MRCRLRPPAGGGCAISRQNYVARLGEFLVELVGRKHPGDDVAVQHLGLHLPPVGIDGGRPDVPLIVRPPAGRSPTPPVVRPSPGAVGTRSHHVTGRARPEPRVSRSKGWVSPEASGTTLCKPSDAG